MQCRTYAKQTGYSILLFIILLFSACSDSSNGSDYVSYIDSWGSKGSEKGQFLYIEDFAFDKEGNLLVSDALRADIQVIGPEGTFKNTAFGRDVFEKPEGVAVDSDGNIYIGDYLSGYIKKFDSSLNLVKVFAGPGNKEGETSEAEFMSFGQNDLLYVPEAGNHRISVFNTNGEFQFSFGELGSEPGMMKRPEASRTDPDGNVFVTDFGNDRIQKFTADGKFLFTFGTTGNGPGQFRKPTGLTIDKFGNLYICDLGNDRIQVFDKNGAFKYMWGSSGSEPGQFGNLHGIIINDQGKVYVADTANNRIQVFQVLDFS